MYVKGVGMTNFGIQDLTTNDMVFEATAEALEKLTKLRKEVVNETTLKEIDAFIERTEYVNKMYKKYIWIIERLIGVIGKLEAEYDETHPEN